MTERKAKQKKAHKVIDIKTENPITQSLLALHSVYIYS